MGKLILQMELNMQKKIWVVIIDFGNYIQIIWSKCFYSLCHGLSYFFKFIKFRKNCSMKFVSTIACVNAISVKLLCLTFLNQRSQKINLMIVEVVHLSVMQ